MFWRFGFQNASAIDSLLDKEDVSLESILDEDDLLQECKGQNTRLIDYFERVDVLHKLLGYVTGQIEGEEKGRFKYPYIATEVLCSDIWSIVATCINEQRELLVPFWETVLDRSPADMKTQMIMASHFAKINSIFLTKRPVEMLAFIQSQPNIVERLLQHIETPSFVDLLGRIIQLDETLPNSNVLEWLSSENLMGRLVDLLSPNHTSSIHTVVADLVKNTISMATPSPAVGLTEGLQNGPASNRFAREIARASNIRKLVVYMLNPFSAENTANEPSEDDDIDNGTLTKPTFESSVSSVVQSIAVVVELIRKNNSDYFEPYLFHALRNRLIHVQQHSGVVGDELRASLENVLSEMVHRMGVVHLGPMLEIMITRLHEFQKYLKAPRSLRGSILTTIGSMTPFTLERYRIVELYAELLHCSGMQLLNRSAAFDHVYDSEGRLQGGLTGMEDLAQVIALSSSNENQNDPMDESNDEDDEPPQELTFPVRNPRTTDSPFSDDDMSGSEHEPNSSDDEAMEEIAMFDEPPLSPIPFREPSLASTSPENTALSENPNMERRDLRTLSADSSANFLGSSPDTDGSGMTSRSSRSGRGSRRSSRSRRRTTLENSSDAHLPIGEQLKCRWVELNILGTLLDMFFEFPWNNFLHSAVYDVIHQVMTANFRQGTYNRELVIALFRDAKILHRIVEGQRRNDIECSKPKGVRLGYMGHLMLISEDVITAMARFPPDLRLVIIQYAPEPDWDNYVTGRYNEAKKEDSRLLGGGKPIVGSSGRGATEWKVDETELGVEPTVKAISSSESNESEGVKGEFRRATSNVSSGGRPISTADFGPPPVSGNVEEEEDDDDDNVTTGRAPHFARYLAQEMGSSDQFGSSDEDDDDEGWLTQSTFGAPLASRTFSERRPLSSNGFGESFEPSREASMAMAEDPFSPHDDDGFGPFSDASAVGGSGSDAFTFTSSFSDEDSSFESFGDFGDFQNAEAEEAENATTPTMTSGSWTFASTSDSMTEYGSAGNFDQEKEKGKESGKTATASSGPELNSTTSSSNSKSKSK